MDSSYYAIVFCNNGEEEKIEELFVLSLEVSSL